MNVPTQDQVLAGGRHVVSYVAGGVTMFAALHIITAGDSQSAVAALNKIGSGFAEIVAGLATLSSVVAGAYAAISANPIFQLLRGSKSVAADPARVAQLQASSVADKAPMVALTDKLPEVAGVATTPTKAGNALADAVPSQTVQVNQ